MERVLRHSSCKAFPYLQLYKGTKMSIIQYTPLVEPNKHMYSPLQSTLLLTYAHHLNKLVPWHLRSFWIM
jgi:hypothetical protein